MTVERWGAYSVIDHTDARKLATDVLLFDRLLLPTPMAWDMDRWKKKGWDPEGLRDTIDLLGPELVIEASWDLDRQKDWKARFLDLAEDRRDINAALQTTRRTLVDNARAYRPPGVTLIETLAAYQSKADYVEIEGAKPAEAVTALIAHRIAVPDDPDPGDALKRARDLAAKDSYLRARRDFHGWQRAMLAQGHRPEDIDATLPKLISAWNDKVTSANTKWRWDTAVMCLSVGLGGVGLAAGLTPGAFGAIGIGPMAGAAVVQVGTVAGGALIQIGQHILGRTAPEPVDDGTLAGAMFHAIADLPGWAVTG